MNERDGAFTDEDDFTSWERENEWHEPDHGIEPAETWVQSAGIASYSSDISFFYVAGPVHASSPRDFGELSPQGSSRPMVEHALATPTAEPRPVARRVHSYVWLMLIALAMLAGFAFGVSIGLPTFFLSPIDSAYMVLVTVALVTTHFALCRKGTGD